MWERYRLFTNFYQPVMKLTGNIRIDGHLKKEYDEAKTPYQRVLASPEVTPENRHNSQHSARGWTPLLSGSN